MAGTSQVRLGLIGIGGFGAVHLRYIETFEQYGLCRLVAAADPAAGRLPAVIEALRQGDCEVYEDADLLLARDDIDAVIIASPIPYHTDQVLAAFASGKHVLIEKPPCATIEQFSALLTAQERSRRICAVGFHQQASPALHWLTKKLAGGLLGKLDFVWSSVRWPRDRAYFERSAWAGKLTLRGKPVFDGPATNALAHMVQLVVTVGGNPVRVGGKLWRARPIESYDTSYIDAQTTDGVNMRIALTHATEHYQEAILHVRGEKGAVTLDYEGNIRVELIGEAPKELRMPCDCNAAMVLDFLRAVQSPDTPPQTSLAQTRGFMDMVHGAYQAGDGIQTFPSTAIAVRNSGAPDEVYTIPELDSQMAGFASDPDQPPTLLTTGSNNQIFVTSINPSPFSAN